MGADFLENLGKTITKTAEKVGKKAEEVVGVQQTCALSWQEPSGRLTRTVRIWERLYTGILLMER